MMDFNDLFFGMAIMVMLLVVPATLIPGTLVAGLLSLFGVSVTWAIWAWMCVASFPLVLFAGAIYLDNK